MAKRQKTKYGREYFRSGQYYSFRQCPVHKIDLELCVDDTEFGDYVPPRFRSDDNRICWRCDECLAYWLENYFIEHARNGLPFDSGVIKFVLPCPKCGSRRVTHSCEAACCGTHQCLDCDTDLKSEISIVRPAQVTDKTEQRSRRIETRHNGTSFGSGPLDKRAIRTGIVRNYRQCEADHALELVLVPRVSAGLDNAGLDNAGQTDNDYDKNLTAWYCETCKRMYNEVGEFRIHRPIFQREVKAAVMCPECRFEQVSSVSQEAEVTHCLCHCCEAKLDVKLV